MAPPRATTEAHLHTNRIAPTWLCAVLGVCALVLQLLSPVYSSTANAGGWMEICGSDGIELVQVDMSDDESSDCPDCGDCTFCTTLTATSAVIPSTHHRVSADGSNLGFAVSETVAVLNPAQFWPDNRGPPLQTKAYSDSACRPSIDETLSKGGAPWT